MPERFLLRGCVCQSLAENDCFGYFLTGGLNVGGQTKSGMYKWVLLGMLWVAYFLQQGTRQIYNAILPQIQNDFAVDSVKIGLVATLFTFAYGLCVPLSGILGDMVSRKKIVVVGVLVFSFGIFFSGAAATIGMIILTYGLVNAVGQSFYYPPSSSLLGQAHDKTRSTALSILQTAQYAGIVICSCVAGYLADLKTVSVPECLAGVFGAEMAGWRVPFYIFGAIGIVWAVFLTFFMRDAEHVHAENGAGSPKFAEVLKSVCSRPSAVLLAGVFGLLVYVDIGMKTWMPTYMDETFFGNLTSANFNFVVWVYGGAFLGVVVGSRICDRLFARFKHIRFSLNLFGFLLMTPFVVLSANTGALGVCKAALLFYGFFKGVCDSCIFASVMDVVPERYRASGMALMICGGFFIGSTSSTILGFIRDHFSLSAGISSLGFFCLVNVVILATIVQFFFHRDHVSA